ncbi:MAG: hypothetical protein MR517_01600 [Bacteroidales bacterium]|nr:hypothetical protein [Bacteroidales bacterium]
MFPSKKSDVFDFSAANGAFSGRKPRKSPIGLILRYFGASPVVVASDALLEALATPSAHPKASQRYTAENIAHCNAPAHFTPQLPMLKDSSNRNGKAAIYGFSV